jgi:hypothetical protein
VVAVLDDVIGDRERYFIHVDGALFAQVERKKELEFDLRIFDEIVESLF